MSPITLCNARHARHASLLHLPWTSTKKQLIDLNLNSFDELLPYNKPDVKKFVKISGCSSFALSAREVFWDIGSFYVHLRDLIHWCPTVAVNHLEDPNVRDAAIDQDQLDLPTVSKDKIYEEKPNSPSIKRFADAMEDLVLPVIECNLIVSDVDIQPLPPYSHQIWVPGTASYWSELFTSMMRL